MDYRESKRDEEYNLVQNYTNILWKKYLGLTYDKKVIDDIIKEGLEEIDRRAAAGQDRWLTEEEVNDLCWRMAK